MRKLPLRRLFLTFLLTLLAISITSPLALRQILTCKPHRLPRVTYNNIFRIDILTTRTRVTDFIRWNFRPLCIQHFLPGTAAYPHNMWHIIATFCQSVLCIFKLWRIAHPRHLSDLSPKITCLTHFDIYLLQKLNKNSCRGKRKLFLVCFFSPKFRLKVRVSSTSNESHTKHWKLCLEWLNNADKTADKTCSYIHT